MKNSTKPARALQLAALVFSCLLVASNAAAQMSATAFTFQGKLSDAGSPADGLYDLQFALYDAPAGGTLQGTLVRDDVVVTQGVFTVTLDYGADVFTTGTGRYLEIGVRPGASAGAFTTLAPRQEVTASPYAIQAVRAEKATSAERLEGFPASSFLRSDTSQTFTGASLNIAAGSALDVEGALLGNGSNLLNLNASNLTAGTVADARLSPNVPLLNAYNIFSGGVQFNSPPIGSGEFLTNLGASNLTGTVPDARLSSNIPRLGSGNTFSAANNNFAGRISANSLSVGGGLPITKILTATATLDFGNGTIFQEVQNISVPGARVGDAVYLGIPENVLPRVNLPEQPPPFPHPAQTVAQPFVYQAFVSAPDTVSVTWDRLLANDGTSSASGGISRSACLEDLNFYYCQPPPGVFRVVVFSFTP